MWYKFAAFAKLIKNLYPYEFWVEVEEKNELREIVPSFKKIVPGQEMGIVAWGKLLKTSTLNTKNENTLLNFLSSRITEDAEGKKVYTSVYKGDIFLANPIIGGFWIEEENKNELGQIVKVSKEIGYGDSFNLTEWKKILRTNQINAKDKDSLKKFLTDDKFKMIGDKKFYVPIPLGKPTLLKNPIVGGFWIEEEKKNEFGEIVKVPKEIGYEEPKGIKEWRKLLKTHKINAEDLDSLKKFLTDDKFKMIGDKKFYVPSWQGEEVLIKNPITEGFYIDGEFIGPETTMNIADWTNKLKTFAIRSRKQSLQEFLSDKLTRNKEGKLEYFYDPREMYRKFYFKNPISEGFYLDGDLIGPETFLSTSDWRRLLSTEKIDKNNPNSLRDFLNQPGILTEIDGKKYYNYTGQKRYIKNPLNEVFWVEKTPIEPNEEFTVSGWAKLLNTSWLNTTNDEVLKDFLSDKRRFRTRNNKKTYIPVKRSSREGLFSEKFYNYNHDDITVKAGKYIIVMTNKTNILYLDFAFMKNDKILLAVEINGYQHYGFVTFGKKLSYQDWQDGLLRDILKINYCYENKIPLLIFNHMLSLSEFKSILDNLHKNPHAYENFIPQPVIDNNPKNTSLEFIKRQIYSHLYPVFNDTITFEDDEAKKRYIKDTLILISKLMGVYENGIDKTDYIRAFDTNVDLTSNYNICLAIYNSLHPDYPLDKDEKITYSDLSKKPRIFKEKPLEKQKPKENLIPSEE